MKHGESVDSINFFFMLFCLNNKTPDYSVMRDKYTTKTNSKYFERKIDPKMVRLLFIRFEWSVSTLRRQCITLYHKMATTQYPSYAYELTKLVGIWGILCTISCDFGYATESNAFELFIYFIFVSNNGMNAERVWTIKESLIIVLKRRTSYFCFVECGIWCIQYQQTNGNGNIESVQKK